MNIPIGGRVVPLWVAGVAAAALVPCAATAQPDPPPEHVDRSHYWSDAGPDTVSREEWLQHAIKAAMDRGDLEENDGNRALAQLEVIRHDDLVVRDAASHRDDRAANAEDIQMRLDSLVDSVRTAIFRHPT
jgi:hypothetical protein